MKLTRWLSPLLILACVSLVGAETEPPANDLNDAADLFGKSAREEVQPILKEIRGLGKNLSFVIETFPTAPEENPSAAAYGEWATQRAKELKVKGVYLLVCKAPSHFELLVDTKTTEKAFTDSDRTELRELLAKSFEKKDFDQGLTAGAKLVREKMKSNLGNGTATVPESGWMYWGSLILILVVLVWVIIAAVRGVWNGGIGGGFMPAFMAALIGATVGLWLYENVISKSSGESTSTEGDKEEGDSEYSGAGDGKDI